MEAVTVYATWPNLPAAEAAATELVARNLVACVNLIPGAVSIYRWDGEMQRDSEVVMIAKTRAAQAIPARDAIVALHPYDTPCVTVLHIDASASHPEFLEWIDAMSR